MVAVGSLPLLWCLPQQVFLCKLSTYISWKCILVIVTPVLCLWGLSVLIKELTLPPTCAILPYALLQVPLAPYLGETRGDGGT